MDEWTQQQEAVEEAIASFPNEFGLRAFRGERFRVSKSFSFWTNMDGGRVMLYTERLCEDGTWKAFAKGTIKELQRELVNLSLF